MPLSEEVCVASLKASSNSEPAEVSRRHSSRGYKARWPWRRAELNQTSENLDYLMKERKQKTEESCPQKDSAELESYEGAPTLIVMVGDDLVEVQLTSDRMLEYILTPANLNRAYRQVKANKGSCGVDKMDVEQLLPYLRSHKTEIVESLLDGNYRPHPVRRVEIPKDGGKTRQLGIPTVVDHVIQQAIAQVLGMVYEPRFSDGSYGFRPGRRPLPGNHQRRL